MVVVVKDKTVGAGHSSGLERTKRRCFGGDLLFAVLFRAPTGVWVAGALPFLRVEQHALRQMPLHDGWYTKAEAKKGSWTRDKMMLEKRLSL